MKRETSLYLDICRFAAALVVFVSHAKWDLITGGLLWPAGNLGVPAVSVFFVLSGFVIAYVTDRRETSLGLYAVSRAARIYSVAAPALAFTILLDALGGWFDPTLYSSLPWLSPELPQAVLQAVAGLGFINELWGWHLHIGSNGPYWSLGFEVWYYVAYAAWLFAPRRWRLAAAAFALLLAGPSIAIMFPLWLIGVLSFHATRRAQIAPRLALALFGVGSATLAGGALWLALGGHGGGQPPVRPLTDLRSLAIDYATGGAFAATILGLDAYRTLGTWLCAVERPIRWIAGCTFTLYLMHAPLLLFLRSISPWPAGSWANRVLIMAGTLAIVLVVAGFTERRKDAWRRAILRYAGVVRSLASNPDAPRLYSSRQPPEPSVP